MKNFIKLNWFKFICLFLALFIIFFEMYWFQFRPAHIRQECSWVKKFSDSVPEVTQEQADKENAECFEAKNDNTNVFNKYLVCGKTSSLAQPAKTWYEPANPSEYQLCIHSQGL